MNTKPIILGELVRERRTEKKIGVRELAKKVGVSPGYISQLEKGAYKNPSTKVLSEIFTILEFDEEHKSLFSLEGEVLDLQAQLRVEEMKRIYISNFTKQLQDSDVHELEMYSLFFQNYQDIMIKIMEIDKKAADKKKVNHTIKEYVDFLHNKHVVNRIERIFDLD